MFRSFSTYTLLLERYIVFLIHNLYSLVILENQHGLSIFILTIFDDITNYTSLKFPLLILFILETIFWNYLGILRDLNQFRCFKKNGIRMVHFSLLFSKKSQKKPKKNLKKNREQKNSYFKLIKISNIILPLFVVYKTIKIYCLDEFKHHTELINININDIIVLFGVFVWGVKMKLLIKEGHIWILVLMFPTVTLKEILNTLDLVV